MFDRKQFAPYAALSILILVVAVATGCGGGAGAASPSPAAAAPAAPAPATGNVTVNFGDAVADRVLSFEVTVTSISLTRSDGSSVSVFSGARRIEVTHLAGTFAPIVLSSVPQGTYSAANVTVTDAEGTFLDSNKAVQHFEDKALARTLSIPFSPALAVSGRAAVVNLDLNVAASLLINLASNTVSVNPEILHKSGTLPETEVEAEHEVEAENGELEHINGAVTTVDVQAGTFTMTVGQSNLSMKFKTDSATRFEINDSKAATLATLATGMLVRVEGLTLPDGSAMAREVEATVALATGAEIEGIVTSITGSPASFTLIAQDGIGGGIVNGTVNGTQFLGSPISVSLAANTSFRVDAGKLTINSNTFPFDAAHFTKGQRVEVDSETEIGIEPNHTAAGLLSARKIKLEKQALVGTVSNFVNVAGGSSFTLNMPADSAFALLTGHTAVAVLTQTATVVKNTVTLPPSDAATQIRVRGLLFFDGTNYKMAASRIELP